MMSEENKNPIDMSNNGMAAPMIDLKEEIQRAKTEAAKSPIVMPGDRDDSTGKLAQMISEGSKYIHAVYIETLDDTVYLRELSEKEIEDVNKMALPAGKKTKISREGTMNLDPHAQLKANGAAERYLVLNCLNNDLQNEEFNKAGLSGINGDIIAKQLSGAVFKELIIQCKLINQLNVDENELKSFQKDIDDFRENSKLTNVISSVE